MLSQSCDPLSRAASVSGGAQLVVYGLCVEKIRSAEYQSRLKLGGSEEQHWDNDESRSVFSYVNAKLSLAERVMLVQR